MPIAQAFLFLYNQVINILPLLFSFLSIENCRRALAQD